MSCMFGIIIYLNGFLPSYYHKLIKKSAKKVIKYFISVTDKLLTLSNFNSAMALSSGLSNYTIQNLVHNLKGNTLTRINKLFDIMSPRNNFQNLRDLYKDSISPFIPPQVVLSRDIALIEEGNATWLDKERGIVNIDKLVLFGNILLRLEKNRTTPFSLECIKFLEKYLKNLKILNENKLEELSKNLN